eukprot:5242870-Pyramimonas_sp.AAC.1
MEWAGDLHAFFQQRGFHFLVSLYGAPFNGYMGVGIAFPITKYKAEQMKLVPPKTPLNPPPSSLNPCIPSSLNPALAIGPAESDPTAMFVVPGFDPPVRARCRTSGGTGRAPRAPTCCR